MLLLISIILALISTILWRKVNLEFHVQDVFRKNKEIYFSPIKKNWSQGQREIKRRNRKASWLQSIFTLSIFLFTLILQFEITNSLELEEESLINSLISFGIGIGLGILIVSYLSNAFEEEGVSQRAKSSK